jgi:hypothetical protein
VIDERAIERTVQGESAASLIQNYFVPFFPNIEQNSLVRTDVVVRHPTHSRQLRLQVGSRPQGTRQRSPPWDSSTAVERRFLATP